MDRQIPHPPLTDDARAELSRELERAQHSAPTSNKGARRGLQNVAMLAAALGGASPEGRRLFRGRPEPRQRTQADLDALAQARLKRVARAIKPYVKVLSTAEMRERIEKTEPPSTPAEDAASREAMEWVEDGGGYCLFFRVPAIWAAQLGEEADMWITEGPPEETRAQAFHSGMSNLVPILAKKLPQLGEPSVLTKTTLTAADWFWHDGQGARGRFTTRDAAIDNAIKTRLLAGIDGGVVHVGTFAPPKPGEPPAELNVDAFEPVDTTPMVRALKEKLAEAMGVPVEEVVVGGAFPPPAALKALADAPKEPGGRGGDVIVGNFGGNFEPTDDMGMAHWLAKQAMKVPDGGG